MIVDQQFFDVDVLSNKWMNKWIYQMLKLVFLQMNSDVAGYQNNAKMNRYLIEHPQGNFI